MIIKGTKPTRSQRTLLTKNGFKPEMYLYVGMDTRSDTCCKSLNRSVSKYNVFKFTNKDTGGIIEITEK